jgi:hypothetical protein
MAQTPLTVNWITVVHRLAVLSKAHQMRDLHSPARDATVQELVRRI